VVGVAGLRIRRQLRFGRGVGLVNLILLLVTHRPRCIDSWFLVTVGLNKVQNFSHLGSEDFKSVRMLVPVVQLGVGCRIDELSEYSLHVLSEFLGQLKFEQELFVVLRSEVELHPLVRADVEKFFAFRELLVFAVSFP